MIDIKSYCESIRLLVKNSKLKDAIEKLLILAKNSHLLNEVLMQSSELTDVEKRILTRTIDDNFAHLTKNKITKAILEITEQIEELGKEENSKIQKQLNLSFEEVIRKMGLQLGELEQKRKALSSAKTRYLCLWIDDDPTNDQIEFQVLAALNIECSTAGTPYEAYAVIKNKETRPDIIVCNSLSRLKEYRDEGLDFCRYLAGKQEYCDIPVILHSISYWERVKQGEQIDLPPNIRNNFKVRDSLIIKDLVEEIVINLDEVRHLSRKL